MRTLVRDAFLELKPYIPGKPVSETERELGIQGCIKLASNENPLGPSPRAVEAIQKAAATIHDYPDGGAFYLRRRLADYLGVAPDALIFGNGTNEVIEMIIRTFVRPDESVVFSEHAFIVYTLASMAAGVSCKRVPTKNLRADLNATLGCIDTTTKVIFVDNPNNPTGTYVSRSEVERFLKAVPEDVVVVLDEAYFEYPTADDYPNGLNYLAERERLLVLRTFSKAYGLAGVRVGYAVGHPTLIEFLNRGREPFNVNTLGQEAALAALDDTAHVEKSVTMNREELNRLYLALDERRLKYTPSQANFVLVDFEQDAQPIFEKLLRQGVIVRPVANYGLPHHVRITVGTPEQNTRLLSALDAVL